ncbi:MAG: addiction module protein [Spirochaetes bacterium]|nr:addiction module protein [Spirochaetota bacterium]
MGIEQAIAIIKSQDLSTEAAILDDIWFDLQQKVMNSPIPTHHQVILDARLDKIEAGQAIFTDWKILKSKLLNAKAH